MKFTLNKFFKNTFFDAIIYKSNHMAESSLTNKINICVVEKHLTKK